MSYKSSIPTRFCPYCAIANKEEVQLTVIEKSTMNNYGLTKVNWGDGGYVCRCCGLQLPKQVFDTLVPMLGMIRMDKCI